MLLSYIMKGVKFVIISYDEFYNLLSKHFQNGDDFYLSLLQTVINNPSRYSGLFRLSNAKSKIIQNITQSREIKFGDIIEQITTEYIERLGYQNFNKNLGTDSKGDVLVADQFFTDGEIIYLVEMKIRDDHDASKKRGQYDNFKRKILRIKNLYPNQHIDASMWFVDNSLVKNKKYYLQEMITENFDNTSLHLYYGGEFFATLRGGSDAWNELITILREYRHLHANSSDVEVPDFGTSKQIYDALLKLPQKYWDKLMSDKSEYVILREELFSSGDNLKKASLKRR